MGSTLQLGHTNTEQQLKPGPRCQRALGKSGRGAVWLGAQCLGSNFHAKSTI